MLVACARTENAIHASAATPPDKPEVTPDAEPPSHVSCMPPSPTEACPSTMARQERAPAPLSNESSTRVSQTTYVHDGVPGRGKRPIETLQEPTLHFQTPSIEASPSAIVQKDQYTPFWGDQASTEAYRAANVSCEAFVEDERPSKRHCDLTPRFTCHLCPKSFTRRTTLNNHQRQHTGERPFRCEFSECGESFAQNNDRKRHENLHGTEKAFQCGGSRSDGTPWGCGKAFARKDGLLEHHHKTVKGRQCLARRDENLEL